MPKVYNLYHKDAPPEAIYIGRSSAYGNPFPITETQTRETVLLKFEVYLGSNPQLMRKIRRELKGKDLVCFCAPKRCHGDILLRIANS